MKRPSISRATGFTLIELLVVMAIISLLATLLIVGVGRITTQAKNAQTKSTFNTLSQGLEQYRGDQISGGEYPPSRSDHSDKRSITDPRSLSSGAPNTVVSGAHLLTMALSGADLLGTPGFKDIGPNSSPDGQWSNDTHAGSGGLYEIDQTTGQPTSGQPKRPRFTFVGSEFNEKVQTIKQLRDAGLIINTTVNEGESTENVPMFVDSLKMPILYYRASKAARFMTANLADNKAGVYRQADNGLITGSDASSANEVGIDFGPGELVAGVRHGIGKVGPEPQQIPVITDGENDILSNASYDHTFTRFILDSSVTAQNAPVRRDSYLLISAGNDQIYGTPDDVTNWERGTK